MFDYGLAHWLAFLGAAALLNLSPGPDLAFILGRTAQSGRRAGFAAMFGDLPIARLRTMLVGFGLKPAASRA